MSDRAEAALKWAVDTFGDVALDPAERAMRFVEEAVELAHAFGLEPRRVTAIVERVYAREQGIIVREIGQAQLTLELLAKLVGHDPQREAEFEFARIKAIPQAEWTRRHEAKIAMGIAK